MSWALSLDGLRVIESTFSLRSAGIVHREVPPIDISWVLAFKIYTAMISSLRHVVRGFVNSWHKEHFQEIKYSISEIEFDLITMLMNIHMKGHKFIRKKKKQFPFQKGNHNIFNQCNLSTHQLRMVEERGPKSMHHAAWISLVRLCG